MDLENNQYCLNNENLGFIGNKNIEIYFIFSGTDLYWEQTSIYLDFTISKPHNVPLRQESINTSIDKYYYCFDGVSISPISHTHKEVTNIVFDPTKSRLTTRDKDNKYSGIMKFKDKVTGNGMTQNATLALKIIDYLHLERKILISKINLIGFSRGGTTCIIAANYIAQKYLNKFCMDLFLIDPVPGPGNFISARSSQTTELIDSTTTIPDCVRRCLISLAVEEKTRFFEPLDSGSLNFLSSKTKFVFLPFPDDHLQNCIWLSGVLKNFFPNSPMYSKSISEYQKLKQYNEFINYLNIAGANKDGIKMLYIFLKMQKYKINIYTEFFTIRSFRDICEVYYSSDFLYNISRNTCLSIQSVNKKNKFLQAFLGLNNSRHVKNQFSSYTKSKLFINKHHELCFFLSYPEIFMFMSGDEYETFKLSKEYDILINYPRTKQHIIEYDFKKFIETKKGFIIDDFSNINNVPFKSTNIYYYKELYQFFFPGHTNLLSRVLQKSVRDYRLNLISIIYSYMFEFMMHRCSIELSNFNNKICDIESDFQLMANFSQRSKSIYFLKKVKFLLTSNEIKKLNFTLKKFGIHSSEWRL
ncbi:hypothetical protein [Spirobacillus cienkowskii]|uniref:hypothetical protein n=1 Tax=Spirobacillus cienkowskii TaxID=495820 RepID=UPI0030CEC1D5